MNILTHKRPEFANIFMDDLFRSYSDVRARSKEGIKGFSNYMSMIEGVDNATNNLALSILRRFIEKTDLEFRNSPERIKKYHVKSAHKRTIMTVFGPLTFNKTFYTDKYSKRPYCYVDDFFGFEKYGRFDIHVKSLVLEACSDMSMAAAGRKVSKAKKSEYGEAGRYISIRSSDGKSADVSINRSAIDKDLMFAGYNLLVTSEVKMTDQDMYDTYHCLWRIEESFRIMKSDLDARPVFLHKEECIKGHFLICYIAVLLERIFQFKVLDNKYPASEIFEFIKGFKLTKTDTKYINTTKYTDFIDALSGILNLPLTNYYLTEKQVKGIQDYKL